MQLPFRRQCETPGFFLETFSRPEYAGRAGMRPRPMAASNAATEKEKRHDPDDC